MRNDELADDDLSEFYCNNNIKKRVGKAKTVKVIILVQMRSLSIIQ